MGDKGEGGVQNFKKWMTSFMTAYNPHKLKMPLLFLCKNYGKNDDFAKNVSKVVKILHCGVRVDRDITLWIRAIKVLGACT